MTLRFLGREFATAAALMAEFPAYGGDASLRAIRAGADTPLKVEEYCWKRAQAGILRARAAAKKNALVVNERAAKARAAKASKPTKRRAA